MRGADVAEGRAAPGATSRLVGVAGLEEMVRAPERLVREDALPENIEYRDTGCELAPRCLACALPRCRYDEPGGARRMFMETRDEEIVRRRAGESIAINALAREYGISRRSVFRILAKANGDGSKGNGHRPTARAVAVRCKDDRRSR